jgi:hypothetical protein
MLLLPHLALLRLEDGVRHLGSTADVSIFEPTQTNEIGSLSSETLPRYKLPDN